MRHIILQFVTPLNFHKILNIRIYPKRQNDNSISCSMCPNEFTCTKDRQYFYNKSAVQTCSWTFTINITAMQFGVSCTQKSLRSNMIVGKT